MEAIELYSEASKITKACKLQEKAFDYWLSAPKDDVYNTLAFDTETTGLTFGVPSVLHLEKTDIKCAVISSNAPTVCIFNDTFKIIRVIF